MQLQSYVFDFRKSPTFLRKWNKEFDVEEIETTCFYIYLLNDICYDNIEQCVDENTGRFTFTDEQLQNNSLKLPCYLELKYVDTDVSDIVLKEDTEYTFGADENFAMKGAFLVTDSGYVMGYSINSQSVNITNRIIFEKGLTFWNIVEGVLNG